MEPIKAFSWAVATAFATGMSIQTPLLAAQRDAAGNFPTKPVRIIVPNTAAGATDIIARLLQARLNELWGQPVVVDNRPGASGTIGFELTAKAPLDGHTLMASSVSMIVVETTMAKTLSVRPSRDLAGITSVMEIPHLLVASGAVPALSARELVEYAKNTGTRLNYAISGFGTYTHLDALRFQKAAGIELTIVPYKGGAGQFVSAIIGNEAQVALVNMASSIAHVRTGKMKALATTWPTRRPELPETPTMAESGFPGIGTNAWNGLFVAAGVPQPLLNRIHADVVKVMDTPSMKEQLAKQYMSVVLSKSPADFAEFLREETKKWRQVVVENKITVE